MNIEPTSRPATIMELYSNKVYCIKNIDGGFTPVIDKKILQQIDAPSTNLAQNPFPKVPLKYKVNTFLHQHGTKIIVGVVILTLAVILVDHLTKQKEDQKKA